MSTGRKAAVIGTIVVVLWLAGFAWDYFDPNSPANFAMQVQLKLFGNAMYEYSTP